MTVSPSVAPAAERLADLTRIDGVSASLSEKAMTRSYTVMVCLVVLTALAVLTAMYFARPVLLPLTMAVVLSLVMRPAVTALRSYGVPNVVGASVLFALLLGAGVVAVTTLRAPAQAVLAQVPMTLDSVTDRLQGYLKPLKDLQSAGVEMDEITKSPGERDPLPVRLEQPALSGEMLNTTGEYVAGVTITLALWYFLLVSGDRFLEKTVTLAPTFRGKREVVATVREIEARIGRYLGAITLVNAGLGVAIGLGLWVIDFPNPLLWGVIAALLNYLPFAGLAIGTALMAVTGIATFESLPHALLAPLIYLVANAIEANLVTPMLLGRSIDLNPVVILLAALLGGWLWGVVGMFLAVPLLIIARVICESVESLHPVAVYLAR
ncbi:AI-2E family transporter [Botrimarina mediterranea]|uniref:AI-2 transport protein TqsA n=2 Tax=Botrimarina mediterranea TaxID=2528022 RepID=A0A518K395_9BACT|nr:AI-2 transport protein TqsA [Botrimarina mediterranea]QDV76801.1 AI-2 transport protein TqsA [Planctomycetes bacterium K2D]